jgi:hypothetical protein
VQQDGPMLIEIDLTALEPMDYLIRAQKIHG